MTKRNWSIQFGSISLFAASYQQGIHMTWYDDGYLEGTILDTLGM